MIDTGDPAPDFELQSTNGATVRLSETVTDGPTVVLVNRGPWCRYCVEQLTSFSNLQYHLWRLLDVDVLPVFTDSISELLEFRDRWELGIQLVSNPSSETNPTYTGLENSPGRGPTPVPGTFVVDSSNTVRYEQVAKRPDDRTYANNVRQFIANGFEDPYPGKYPNPYID